LYLICLFFIKLMAIRHLSARLGEEASIQMSYANVKFVVEQTLSKNLLDMWKTYLFF
jgi:hypothetical protein